MCDEERVGQDCVLSPILFNMYSEHIFNQAIGDDEEGITINGRTLNNSRYAEVTSTIVENSELLQSLINKDAFGRSITHVNQLKKKRK